METQLANPEKTDGFWRCWSQQKSQPKCHMNLFLSGPCCCECPTMQKKAPAAIETWRLVLLLHMLYRVRSRGTFPDESEKQERCRIYRFRCSVKAWVRAVFPKFVNLLQTQNNMRLPCNCLSEVFKFRPLLNESFFEFGTQKLCSDLVLVGT